MSAFIVSNETITAIAEGLKRFNITFMCDYHRFNPHTDFMVVGQKLLEQNYRSVNFRYDEDTETPKWEPEYYWREYPSEALKEVGMKQRVDYTLAQIYGAVSCYEYQSCETKDWNTSPILQTLQQLKDCITEALFEEKGETVPWGIIPFEFCSDSE